MKQLKKMLFFIGVFVAILLISSTSVFAATYLWPVPGVSYISGYYGNGHAGIDIAANGDHDIVAAREGTVIAAASTSCTHINNYPNACCNYGMGNYVQIKHSDGSYATYMHMRYGSITVSVGQYVNRGTKIGMMGSSGNSTGQHLHFQVGYSSSDTINVNPDAIGYDYNNTSPSAPSVDSSTGKTIISWKDEYSAEKYNVRIKNSNGECYDIWDVIERDVQIILPIGQYTVYIDYVNGDEYTKGTVSTFNVNVAYDGPTTSELYVDTSGNSVNMTWGKSINAQGYNVRISDANGTDYTLWNQTETYASVVLPLGIYYAYVDSYKGNEVTKGKKICFEVTQSYLDIEAVTPSVSVSESTVRLTWKNAKNAVKYSIRIKKSDGTSYDIWNITDTTTTIVLPKGSYSVYIDCVNDYGFVGGDTVDFVVAETIVTLDASVSRKGTTHTIDVGLYNIDTPCNVMVAGYKEGRLITLESKEYSRENEAFTVEGDIDEIKVMVWDGTSILKPVCDAETIPLK